MRQKLGQQVLERIENGDLKALGYCLPRAVADLPHLLPDELWAQKIDWSSDEIKGNGLHFVAVRIIDQATAAKIEGALIESAPNRLPGRRSRQSEIERAYDALRDAGKLDYRSLKTNFDRIKQFIKQQNPDDPDGLKGLGDKALSKHLGPRFREDKARLAPDL